MGAPDGRILLVPAESGGLWLLQPEAGGGALRWFGPARPLQASPAATGPAATDPGRAVGACGDHAVLLTEEGDQLVSLIVAPPEGAGAAPRSAELGRAPALGPLSGASVACLPAADPTGEAALLVGLPGARAGAGAVYRWTIGQTPAPILLGPTAGQLLGGTTIAGHDLNGDGLDDLAVSAWGAMNNAGAVWLIDGPLPPIPADVPDRRYFSRIDGDVAGFALAYAGDTDGDGYGELLVGAHGADHRGWSAGAAYLVDPRGRGPLDRAQATFLGDAANDRAGWSVAGGADVNNDGRADLIIGAPGVDSGAAEAGAVFLRLGGERGVFVLSPASALRAGPSQQAQLGEAVALLPADGGLAFGRARRAPPGTAETPALTRLQPALTPRR